MITEENRQQTSKTGDDLERELQKDSLLLMPVSRLDVHRALEAVSQSTIARYVDISRKLNISND